MNTTPGGAHPARDDTGEGAALVLRRQLRALLAQCVEEGLFSERDSYIVKLRLALIDGVWH